MSNTGKYVFALQIENADRFIDIFGPNVSSIAWDDIVVGYRQITQKLFQRYHLLSDVVSPSWGRCFIIFATKQSSMPLDMEEQISALTAAGRQLVREILQENLGVATGSHLDFKIIVAPIQNDLRDTQRINEKLNTLFKSLPPISSPFGSITYHEFAKIIERKEIETFVQSIVSLPDEVAVGYEALSRGPSNSAVQGADLLFGTAAHFGLTEKLELLCLEKALKWLVKVPAPLWMSINIGPASLKSPAFPDLIYQHYLKPFLPRLVIELTEHLPVGSAIEFQEIIQNLKRNGIRLSLDDTGCGFFDLDTVEKLRPEIVKLCITVINRIGQGSDILKEIKNAVSKIAQFGGETLGEGVERKEQLDELKQCGVSLAQGYYFDRPRLAEEVFKVKA